jgi:hypothetical protein
MPCNHYIYRDPSTGSFRIAKSGTDFFIYTDCGSGDCPICDTCQLEDGLCKCLDLETITNISLNGSAPTTPPTSGYFLPRYATVTIGGSDVTTATVLEWELWSPSGECDSGVEPFGDPTPVVYNPLSTGMTVTCAGGSFSTGGTLEIEWNGGGWDWDWQYTVNDCGGVSGRGCSGGTTASNEPLQVRYRRAYNDFVTLETQYWTVQENCDFGGGAYGNNVTLSVAFNPTCRPPATGTYCNCIDEDYNVIDLSTLDTYTAPEESGVDCCGKPIDIDTNCGDVGSMTSWVLYYAPYSGTVPVISGVAYDTIDIPDGSGIEVIEVKTFSSQNEARTWVCNYLKFATVGNSWPTDPDDLEYNWPYNDLYFNACAGGVGSINLVPC